MMSRLMTFIVLVCIIIQPILGLAQEPVTITFLHGWTGREALIEETIRQFEEEYPWITVKPTLVGAHLLAERIMVTTMSGVPFDVVMTTGGAFEGWNETMLPLDPFLEKDGLAMESLFYPFVCDQVRSYSDTGEVLYLPLITSIGRSVLYTNHHMFDVAGLDPNAPPTTWRDLEQMEYKLQQKEGERLVQVGLAPVDWDNMLEQMDSWRQSAGSPKLWVDHGERVELEINEYVETVEWVLDYINRYFGGWSGLQEVYSLGSNPHSEFLFQDQRAAMTVSGEHLLYRAKSAMPQTTIGVSLIPTKSEDGGNFSSQAGWGYAISAGTKHPEAAWLFLQWLTVNTEQVVNFLEPQFRPGAAIEVNRQLYQLNPEFGFFIDALVNSSWPTHQLPKAIESDFSQRLTQVLRAIFANGLPPRGAMEELARQIEMELIRQGYTVSY